MHPAITNQRTKPTFLAELIAAIEHFIPFFILTETHLDQTVLDAEVKINDYNIFRADRITRKCGGTAIYVHQSITINKVEKYSDTVCEAVFLYSKELNLIIIGVYRPPSGHYTKDINTSFSDLLNASESFIKKYKNAQIMMMGDMNLPSVNWTTETVKSDRADTKCGKMFLRFMDKHLLEQHVNETTRKEKNTLDIIVTNIPAMIHSIQVEKVANSLSDHDLLNCFVTEVFKKGKPTEEPYEPSHPFDKLNFKEANWQEIREQLKNVNWSSLLEGKDVEEMSQEFESKLVDICEKNTPKHKLGGKSKQYIPAARRAMIKLKSNLNHKINLNKYVKPNKDKAKIDKLITKKLEVEEKIRESHKAEEIYKEQKMLAQIKTNPRALYSYAKRKKKVKSNIGPLEDKNGNFMMTLKRWLTFYRCNTKMCLVIQMLKRTLQ